MCCCIILFVFTLFVAVRSLYLVPESNILLIASQSEAHLFYLEEADSQLIRVTLAFSFPVVYNSVFDMIAGMV